jgi:hypothetical protein
MLYPLGRTRRRLPQLVALAGVILMVAACAGSPQSAGGPEITADHGPGGTTPSDAGPAGGVTTTSAGIDGPPSTAADVAVLGASDDGRCGAANLIVEVEDESGEAGHQHRRIVLTNSGTAPCTVTGYPGVTLLDPADRPLGLPATRELLPIAAVTLAAGASASAALDQQSPGVFPADACGVPAAVAAVQVIVPDDTVPIKVRTHGEACPNGVDQLSVRPLQAGRDSQP